MVSLDIFKEKRRDHDEMDINSFIGIAIHLWFFIRCDIESPGYVDSKHRNRYEGLSTLSN